MSVLNIGLIGCGSIANKAHIPNIQSIPNTKITKVWSRTLEKAQHTAKKFHIPNVVSQWEDIVRSPDIDAIIIATPPVAHLAPTKLALQHNKHVLCQARMARNLNEAQEMYDLSCKSNVVTALYPYGTGLKGNNMMKRLINEEKYLGDLYEVKVTAFNDYEMHSPRWRKDSSIVGVNSMTLGMWVEILNRWVPPAKNLTAQAKTHQITSEYINKRTPNSIVVGAILDNGATASYHFSGVINQNQHSYIELYGSDGVLVYDIKTDTIRGAQSNQTKLSPIKIPDNESTYNNPDLQFIQAIQTKTRMYSDFKDGLKYMQFCEAVAQSIILKKSIDLPPKPKMDGWGYYLN